jgi:DNA-directed RNA polymerase specialized sigma24 family protein
MISSLHLARHRRNSNETRSYATAAGFQELFTREMTDFFQLSLQLTADANKAERCLTLAMKDCFGMSTLLKGFARTWARRMVIKHAIQLVLGINNEFARDAESEFHLQPSRYPIEELRESVAILALPNFDRLALVICVLERLSILDCALLLRKSPKEVNDAIMRATHLIAYVADRNHTETTKTPRTTPAVLEFVP